MPGPRYTSYPTVPYWSNEGYDLKNWKKSINQAYWTSGREVSLYIHLPFCESLCTYCACNTRITKNHGVEEKYVKALLKEWQMNLSLMPGKPVLKDLHLGGGTPTFFSPMESPNYVVFLKKLSLGLKATQIIQPMHISKQCISWGSIESVSEFRILMKMFKSSLTEFSLIKM